MARSDWLTSSAGAASPRGSVGREDLVAACDKALVGGQHVIVTGPAGIGKSTVVHEVGQSALARKEMWLNCAAVPVGPEIPGAVLLELTRRIPSRVMSAVAPDVSQTLRSNDVDSPQALISAWTTMLRQVATQTPVLITVDNADESDHFSLEVLGACLRSCRDVPVRAVLSDRRMPPAIARVLPHPVSHFEVPPLSADAVAALLEQYGLPAKLYGTMHVDSAGNPSLLVALAGAMSYRSMTSFSSDTISPVVSALIHDRLEGLDAEATESLQLAAHAANPTLTLLHRAGRRNAEEEIARASACGLVACADDRFWFTPAIAAKVVMTGVTTAERIRIHEVLAEAVSTPEEAKRHKALADPTPHSEFAAELAEAGYQCRERGQASLAAELLVLAADRVEVGSDLPSAKWLAEAANLAAATGDETLTRSTSARALQEGTTSEERVLARLSTVRLAGHNTATLRQELTTAEMDASDDDEALAKVHLWQAWAATLAGNLPEAQNAGALTADHALATGDSAQAAMGLAISAMTARHQGSTECYPLIEQALEYEKEPRARYIHLGASFFHARFLLNDDQLEEASTQFGKLLAIAQRSGPMERVSVLRALLETSLRMGRCAHAVSTCQQIADEAARNGFSPGPSWYSAAMTELAAGSLARAVSYASQGVRASEQDQDVTYTRLNMSAGGQALLRLGRPHDAVDAFRRLSELDVQYGYDDPTSVRYHADFVAALVAVDDIDQARSLLAEKRELAKKFPKARSVEAQLLRSEALITASTGDFDAAEDMVAKAAEMFHEVGMPLERGHCLLVLGQFARQRRRHAAARAHVQKAERIFSDASAYSWLSQCSTFRKDLDGSSESAGAHPGRSATSALTEAELRIARLVAQGATNKEIAQRLYLSVKTVEATLTRVYRKVGVRSRTQLGTHLGLSGE